MRVVLQRVTQASVSISGRRVGEIAQGFLLLAGFTHSDTAEQVVWMAEKIAGLRIFSDPEGKMNLALAEVGGAGLVVSRLPLDGASAEGRRSSYIAASRPEPQLPIAVSV